MGFQRITILGPGLLGGSLGLACRQVSIGALIVGYSPDADELKRAESRGAIHQGSTNLAAAVSDADLVVLCTPVGAFTQLMPELARFLKPGAFVTDVGSTKRSVVQLARHALAKSAAFVGSHPMAGGEKHGIENARADLFTGALCIITTTDFTEPSAVDRVEQFWQSLKMRTVRMSAQEHDRLTADISHLPHAIAAALVRIQSTESVRLAGRGYRDTTRIAASDATLWRDILLDNRDNVKAGLDRLQGELQRLIAALDAGDSAVVQEWLHQAAEVRNAESSALYRSDNVLP
jgi:prephenate dehydrogenase